MERIRIAPTYSADYLEVERPQPLSDRRIEQLIADVVTGKLDADTTDSVYTDFKREAANWILGSKLNILTGLDTFDRLDLCIGCTQFIDTLYMSGPVQTLRHDYKYHERLNLSFVKDVGGLIPNVPLIIAMPFPNTGAIHSNMDEILYECISKNIPVHIDGAWITCSRDISFNFSHPAIRSVGISLSKGLGLGWNRIGLRWTKESKPDAITIMNDFNMNNRALAMIGLHFIRNLPSDYLWNTHRRSYYKVCYDFNLMPTNSIYLALNKGQPVGVSPLIRYLENESS